MSDSQQGIDWSEGQRLMAGPYFLGLYQPSPETTGYWDAVRRGELVLKWCPHCAKAFHPKRIVCTDCGADDLAWKKASGRATVYSFSEVHRAPGPPFTDGTPYTIGLVCLEEGVHMLSRLFAEPGPVAIDAPATVDFRILETGQLLPVFKVGAV